MLHLVRNLLVVATAVTIASGAAYGADGPLLVVVESAPGHAVDADDVRQSIGAELRTPIVAPRDAAAAGVSDVLIVTFDRGEIRTSLRASAAALVSRTIPEPSERPARLRAVGWLAGNLARDQVSRIVTPLPAVPPVESLLGPAPVTAVVSRAATEAPPLEAATVGPAATLSSRTGGPVAAADSKWSVTAAAGATATPTRHPWDTAGAPGTLATYDAGYQLEVQRQSSPESFIFGAALDAGPASQLLGFAGFVGLSWHRRGWFLEANAGIGLQAGEGPQQNDDPHFHEQLCDRADLRNESDCAGPARAVRPGGRHGWSSGDPIVRPRRAARHHCRVGGTRVGFRGGYRGREVQAPLNGHPGLRSVIGVGPPADADEAAIVEGLRRGRLEALAGAFDRWHQRVRVLARRLLSDDAAAEDVVQDVFAALPRAMQRFRGDADLETFLLAIAVKRARHHQRAAIRRRRALARLAGEVPRRPRDPEHDTYRRELGLRLGAALDRLPLPQRVAFVLCEIEELTSVQAAVVAAAPEATVRTRLHHARRRLRELLAEERDE